MSKVSIEYCGVHGQGRNVTEAKKDAVNQITSMMHDGFHPCIVTHPKYRHLAFVWRDGVHGWVYRIVDPSNISPDDTRSMFGQGDRASKDETVQAARRHLAQTVMRPMDDDQTGLEFLTGYRDAKRDYKDHLEYVAWQRAYRLFADSGRNDVDSHRLACQMEHSKKMNLVLSLTEAGKECVS